VAPQSECAEMAASSSVAQNDIKPIPGLQPGSELFEVLVGDAEIVLKGEDQSTTRDVMLNGERLVIAMIADGHGGKEASAHCKAMVVDELLEGLKVPDGLHVRAAGTHAFLKAHEEVLAMKGTTAGSTLSVIVLNATRAELTVLHCGDSVARLIPRHSAAMGLCEDHRLESSESERARVCAMGGKVARAMDRHGRPSGPVRLWPGGVAQARAIGDRDVGHFIDPKPFARTYKLPAAESFAVVVASDGVWDALLPSAVDGIIRSSMVCQPADSARLVIQSSLIQRHAYSNDGDRIPKDDTSCIVIRVESDSDLLRGGGCCCVIS